MADVEACVASGQPNKRTLRKISYRGVDLDALLDMSTDELVKLFPARARRRKRKLFLARKPEPVRTHLRNMFIVLEMIGSGSFVGVYNENDRPLPRGILY